MDAAWDIPIATPRLTLRAMTHADAADLCRIVTIPTVGRMLFVFPPDWTEPAARDFIDAWAWRGDLRLRLAVCDAQGRFIGSVGVARHEAVEVFYFLDPACAGQGYATEAMQAFLAFLFARFDPPEITAGVFIDNPASSHVLGKLGFQPSGDGMAASAARLEPAPVSLYRLSKTRFESLTS
ncbi:GNAT family N-acetyltransferase [Actibacterium sp. D379-3]